VTDFDIQAVIDTAQQVADPTPVNAGSLYVVRSGDATELLDLTGDKYQALPSRKRGTVTVRDADSFITYWGKHSDVDSEVYADRDRRQVTAVLDANTTDGARWGDHRLILQLTLTDAWEAWKGNDGRLMGQEKFAEFLEDWRTSIIEPSSADMLELAQSFQATTKATFSGGTRLASGQRELAYVEDTKASAGKGSIQIPETFTIALPVFEGATHSDKLTARFKYRLTGGELQLAYRLDQPDEVLNVAFEQIAGDLTDSITRPILRGTPLR
jgi:uncharacterized protein YfdQ (DUF2303 family)